MRRRRVAGVGGHPAAERQVQELVATCHAGLDSMSLQRAFVERLGAVVPVDAVFCASVDPATLLFTGAVTQEIPHHEASRFLANELLEDDVNKFRSLAHRRSPVDWLDRVTGAAAGRQRPLSGDHGADGPGRRAARRVPIRR